MGFETKEIGVVEYSSLPKHIKEIIRDRHNFSNDCMVKLFTELEEFSMEDIECWKREMERDGSFTGDINDFIIANSLLVEKYIIDQFDIKNPKSEIWINICW